MNIPVAKNQRLTVDIIDLNASAQGLARVDGYVLFVPGALPGERVEILVIKCTSRYGIGKLLHILTPSPDRMEPLCVHYAQCGGCTLQHMSYAAQLEFKRKQIQSALHSIASVRDIDIPPVLGMDHPWDYRSKAAFPFAQVDGQTRFGMYSARSHDLIALQHCPIQHPMLLDVARDIQCWAQENSLNAWDSVNDTGLLRHIVLRLSVALKRVQVVLVTRHGEIPALEQLCETLLASGRVQSIFLNINTLPGNAILGDEMRHLAGELYLQEELDALVFDISPRAFFQVNIEQTRKLYALAREFAMLQPHEVLLDAYCGTGTIGQYLARDAQEVLGLEIEDTAILDARRNAQKNSISNAYYEAGPTEKILPHKLAQHWKPDVILMDPPRKGCDPDFLQSCIQSGAQRLLYISCNPATLARDMRILMDGGYTPQRLQGVDLFPQTLHVETCVLLSK